MTAPSTVAGFRHEALIYAGFDGFVAGVAPFIADGVARDEPVLVVVDVPKIEALTAALGTQAARVQFADMAVVGSNPGRIIPAWQDFVDEHGGRGQPLRGVGEPIGPSRTAVELAECHRHEALLNVAFDGGPPWWLVCPYDELALNPEIITEAQHNHPYLVNDGEHRPSPGARSTAEHAQPFTAPLDPPPANALRLLINDGASVAMARHFATDAARDLGISAQRAEEIALVVSELAANSVRHARTAAHIAAWSAEGSFICEVRDGGHPVDALAGRRRPPTSNVNGRGLWIAQQLSDLVQQRTLADGNVVRVHFRQHA